MVVISGSVTSKLEPFETITNLSYNYFLINMGCNCEQECIPAKDIMAATDKARFSIITPYQLERAVSDAGGSVPPEGCDNPDEYRQAVASAGELRETKIADQQKLVFDDSAVDKIMEGAPEVTQQKPICKKQAQSEWRDWIKGRKPGKKESLSHLDWVVAQQQCSRNLVSDERNKHLGKMIKNKRGVVFDMNGWRVVNDSQG